MSGGRYLAAFIFAIHHLIIACDDQSKWIRPHEMVRMKSSGDDRSKWIRPHEMVREKPSGEKATGYDRKHEARCLSECEQVKHDIEICETNLDDSRMLAKRNPVIVWKNRFKEFLINLSKSYCLPELDEHEKFQVRLRFTADQCQNLDVLAYSPSPEKCDFNEFQQILMYFIEFPEIVSDIQFHSRWDLISKFIRDYGYEILTIEAFAALLVSILWVISRVTIIKRLLLTCLAVLFVLSIPWNWWHMYKKKEAEQMVIVAKARLADPCGQPSFWKSLASYFSIQVDECRLHAEASNIHPAFEILPLAAVSVTISRMFLEPLENVGVSLNKLFKSILQGLPLLHQMAIIILLGLLSILSLFLFCGYNIRSILFTIGPSKRNTGEIEDMKRKNDVLEHKILKLEKKLNKKIKTKANSHPGGEDSVTSDLLKAREIDDMKRRNEALEHKILKLEERFNEQIETKAKRNSLTSDLRAGTPKSTDSSQSPESASETACPPTANGSPNNG